MTRPPAVDYRKLRLYNITSPEYRHLLLLSGWLVYFVLYFLTENLIPPEHCYPVHCRLDDFIPFCEYFLIPYFGWYGLIVYSLWHYLRYDIAQFKSLQIYIMITQGLAMACYILFPTRQDLRPESFANDNIFTALIGLLYQADTNTGVCPSLHVAYSLGIASAWLKDRQASRGAKGFVTVFVILVCLSTMFIKQHSAVDFFAALPVCLIAERFAFKHYWKTKDRKR